MRKFKKFLSVVLSVCMIASLISGLTVSVSAAATSVQIVSFVRGDDTGLRSSELLEARVSGYDGKLSDLTFEWKNELWTYLYVYNSSNMYNIKDTIGEHEIGSYSLYKGKGYAWAAVYGANLNMLSLFGSISVKVTDKNGNVIGEDSYEGFKSPNLPADLQETTLGLFVGESMSIKDMLGRSAIVHIDCEECFVREATVTSGSENISMTPNGNEYVVKGKNPGTATISMTVKKGNCKFHQNKQGTISNTVHIFEKPETTTTTTTLTLTHLDDRCEYFIGNVKGVRDSGSKTITFAGLEPNTKYEVMVKGTYEDSDGQEKYVYAYVSDTTKPTYLATVEFYTDNKLATTLEHFRVGEQLYIKEKNAEYSYLKLSKAADGVYTTEANNGVYNVFFKNGDTYSQVGKYQLTIDGQSGKVEIRTYSVRYETVGGAFADGKSKGGVYYADTPVSVVNDIPTKAGYIFTGWKDAAGKSYAPGQEITKLIGSPIVLTAQWEEAKNVKVNVTVTHNGDQAPGKDDVSFRLVKEENGANIPTAYAKTISPQQCDGYVCDEASDVTTYTANDATFKDVENAEYSVSVIKSGYDVAFSKGADEADGTKVLNVELTYNPSNFDLKFDVAMDEDVPQEFYPAGVNVKVSFWNNGWEIISQHKDIAPIAVGINPETGKGSGSYPVWKHWSGSNNAYEYRIEVESYILADGTVVPAERDIFTNFVSIEGGGRRPTYPTTSTDYGAYFDGNGQNGTPKATINIKRHSVTFNANGGTVNGEATKIVTEQVVIPEFDNYVPVREGGYFFVGWYEDEALTVPATEGKLLDKDITLWAKWNNPLTVSGTVDIATSYEQNGETIKIHEIDLAPQVMVVLQVLRNGGYNDVASQKVNVNYNIEDGYAKGNGTASYSFGELPDVDGLEYRIRTELVNYETTYDNNGDKTYSASEYTAKFKNSKATVDAKMDFVPVIYTQDLMLDASNVGDGFKPQSASAKVLFQTIGSNEPYTVISQHTNTNGEQITMNGNTGTASVEVWRGIATGALSNYQMKVVDVDGEAYDDDKPYTITYGAISRWDTIAGAPMGVLTATVKPKNYMVTFDLNADGDVVKGMDNYALIKSNVSADGTELATEEIEAEPTTYITSHTWSFDTEITAKPEREGYVFAGWKAVENESDFNGTSVVASVDKNITLQAQWEEFKWVTDTDSGYIWNADKTAKSAIIRFLFDVATSEANAATITETGIKYIKAANILDDVENSTFAGGATDGKETTFYGDIIDVTEDKENEVYYAVGYVKAGEKTYWSDAVKCGPDFNKFIEYK